jgi:hypothetical protein
VGAWRVKAVSAGATGEKLQSLQGTAGFFDAAMVEFFADLEGGGEATAGELALAEALVSDAAPVQAVGFAPGVLAIGMFGAVERLAGVLQGALGFAGGEQGFGEREAKVDGEFPEAAGVGEEDAGFGFFDRLGVVAEVALEFAGGMEAAELEFDFAGVVGKGAGVFQMMRGLSRVVGDKQPGEEGVAATKSIVVTGEGRENPVALCLGQCSGPIASKEIPLSLPDAGNIPASVESLKLLEVGCSSLEGSQGEVRGCSIAKSSDDLRDILRPGGKRNRTLRMLQGARELPGIQFELR